MAANWLNQLDWRCIGPHRGGRVVATCDPKVETTKRMAELMIGAELVLDEARTPAQEVRNALESRALENGLLVLGAGFNTLRFCPPLMIDRETVQAGLEIFDKSLTQAEQEAGLL